jgi:hypothetical protein
MWKIREITTTHKQTKKSISLLNRGKKTYRVYIQVNLSIYRDVGWFHYVQTKYISFVRSFSIPIHDSWHGNFILISNKGNGSTNLFASIRTRYGRFRFQHSIGRQCRFRRPCVSNAALLWW